MIRSLGLEASQEAIAPFVRVYTQADLAQAWLRRQRGRRPHFVCVLGFTATGLIPGISAAGATPADRRYTAIADAEFLMQGPQPQPRYRLPPLQAGASPVLITRALVQALGCCVTLLNAGLPIPPAVPCEDLGGTTADCVSSGRAIAPQVVQHLFQQGLAWGARLAQRCADQNEYLMVSECVVGGTTTALAVLKGLGIEADGKVNSSHPQCNHPQKQALVTQGLTRARLQSELRPEFRPEPRPEFTPESSPENSLEGSEANPATNCSSQLPFAVVAAVGDPMQIVVSGMALAASAQVDVLLAGGTQMLAVYALTRAIAQQAAPDQRRAWRPEAVVVGTTRWVAEDPSGDTVGLAQQLAAPLLATPLNFSDSRHATLRAYEQGYVKEGVGAGGMAIAASLGCEWGQQELLSTIDDLADAYLRVSTQPAPQSTSP